MKLEKVYRIMSRRYEVFVAAELAEEKELMEKFPEAYEVPSSSLPLSFHHLC
jgi:hypothetical protein